MSPTSTHCSHNVSVESSNWKGVFTMSVVKVNLGIETTVFDKLEFAPKKCHLKKIKMLSFEFPVIQCIFNDNPEF